MTATVLRWARFTFLGSASYVLDVKWTPAIGARAAAARLGEEVAIRQLCALMTGDVSTAEVPDAPWNELILDIAGTSAEWVRESDRHNYWPRAWAARALCYVGDLSVVVARRRDAGRALAGQDECR
jgi:hypothetical protein